MNEALRERTIVLARKTKREVWDDAKVTNRSTLPHFNEDADAIANAVFDFLEPRTVLDAAADAILRENGSDYSLFECDEDPNLKPMAEWARTLASAALEAGREQERAA